MSLKKCQKCGTLYDISLSSCPCCGSNLYDIAKEYLSARDEDGGKGTRASS